MECVARFVGGNMLKLRFLAVLLVLAAFAGVASAQSGSIQGTVADNSGAVVQGADVIVRSIETNAQRAVTTSASGVYSVPNLPVGHYEITVKKESFKAYHLEQRRSSRWHRRWASTSRSSRARCRKK